MSNEELQELFESNLKSEGQQLAKKHVPLAIRTLAATLRSRKAPQGAKVQAAKVMLEKAEGRAPQAVHNWGNSGGGDRITINILQLGEGEQRSVHKVIGEVDPQEFAGRVLAEYGEAPEQDDAPWE